MRFKILSCLALLAFSVFYWYVASAADLVYYEIIGDDKICHYGPNAPTLIIKSYQTCPRTI